MPKRKTSRAKSSKSSRKAKKKVAPKKSAARKKSAIARTPTSAKKSAGTRRPAPSRRRSSRARSARSGVREIDITLPPRSGTGPTAGGQSGDIESLSDTAIADSESVEELAAEGQDYEAEIVDAVEGAPDPDQGEVKTREIPEDDVRDEYKNDRGNR